MAKSVKWLFIAWVVGAFKIPVSCKNRRRVQLIGAGPSDRKQSYDCLFIIDKTAKILIFGVGLRF